jgi:hypothetical protein
MSDENRKKHTAASSKTPATSLPDPWLSERIANEAKEKYTLKREVKSLKKELAIVKKRLEETQITLDGSDGTDFLQNENDPPPDSISNTERDEEASSRGKEYHSAFMNSMQGVCQDISNDKKKFADIAKSALIDLFRQGVENEKKKNDYEFVENDVEELATHLLEQITNMSRNLYGKKKQQRYSPLSMQVAYAMWSRSSAAYREMRELSQQMMPCERRLRDAKQQNKVRDGEDVKAYQLRAAARGIESSEYGYLMCDEMKLKHGVLWNSMTGEAVGLADDMLDLSSVLKRLMSEEGDAVKPAVYVNQWRYISITADKTEGWMCGFFFNDGSLTGDTILRQFDYVTLCCESIGAFVYGLVMDAGGNNAKFASRLHDDLKYSEEAEWIDEEFCYTKNIWDPNRRIYFWFCMTHLLKAMRNQLLASQPNGSKAFLDKHGNSFGWAFIVKLNNYLKDMNDESLAKDVRLNDKSANPTSYRKMDVSLAKIISEHKTLHFAEFKLCQALDIDAADIKKEVLNRPRARINVSRNAKREQNDGERNRLGV